LDGEINVGRKKMRDPILIIGLAEMVLFFVSWGLVLQSRFRKVGIALFVIWALVFLFLLGWAIVRKFG
jgi:hypothetical protein